MNPSSMSRAELEDEARRIGVIAPERLGRAALERRVRDHHGSPFRRARKAFRSLVGIAKTIAGAPPSLPRDDAASRASSTDSPAPKPEEPKATAEPPLEEATRAEAEAEPEPAEAGGSAEAEAREAEAGGSAEAEAREAEAGGIAEAEAGGTAEAEPAEAEPAEAEAEDEAEAEAEPAEDEAEAEPAEADHQAKAKRSPSSESLADEPIPTRTMARLLADQGHERRALAIYRKLLRDRPQDDDLRHEVERLEAGRSRSSRRGAPSSSSSSSSSDDDDGEGAEVVAVPVGRQSVLVAWSVAGQALAEAGALLEGGSLEARIVVVRADSSGAIRREIRERPVESAGEWVVPVYAGARVTAAVGLQRGGRFVSVAHAPVVVAGAAPAPKVPLRRN